LPVVASDSLMKETLFLVLVPFTAAIIALTFLAMGLDNPLFTESLVHASPGALLSKGIHPGNAIGGGGDA